MEALIGQAIHLGILIGLLYFVLRKPVRQFFSERHERIQREVDEVRVALRAAKERSEELSAKLKGIDAELASMRRAHLAEAERAKDIAVKNAERMSATLVQDAERSSEALFSDLKNEIVKDLGMRVLAAAEERIRSGLTAADRSRLRETFTAQVGDAAVVGTHKASQVGGRS